MPLVILCGPPCGGKTALSRRLADYITESAGGGKTVEVISEEDHDADRATAYGSSALEKRARANFLSAVERRVSCERIVIADGLNYIKGFRYQLYCVARAASTPHCLLYCQTPASVVRARNEALARYPPAAVEELLGRFEEPHYAARWDTPMFTADERGEGVDWPAILETLQGAVARPPSMATTVKITSSADLLAELDRGTQRTLDAIQQRIKAVGVPTSISFPESGTSLLVKRPVTGTDWQRLRRQFIHLNRLHQADVAQIEGLFVKFLESNL